MKKRFLSVIVLSAALFSVQAQEGKGGISPGNAGQIKTKLSRHGCRKGTPQCHRQ